MERPRRSPPRLPPHWPSCLPRWAVWWRVSVAYWRASQLRCWPAGEVVVPGYSVPRPGLRRAVTLVPGRQQLPMATASDQPTLAGDSARAHSEGRHTAENPAPPALSASSPHVHPCSCSCSCSSIPPAEPLPTTHCSRRPPSKRLPRKSSNSDSRLS